MRDHAFKALEVGLQPWSGNEQSFKDRVSSRVMTNGKDMTWMRSVDEGERVVGNLKMSVLKQH